MTDIFYDRRARPNRATLPTPPEEGRCEAKNTEMRMPDEPRANMRCRKPAGHETERGNERHAAGTEADPVFWS